MFRLVVVLLTSIALAACASYYPVRDFSYPAIARELQPGDRVVAMLRDGTRVAMKVEIVSSEAVIGHDSKGERVKVRFADVTQLTHREVDGGPTTLIVLVIAAAVGGLFWLAHGLGNMSN